MVYAIYFSPTNTSKKNALAVAGEFSKDFKQIDLTILSRKQSLQTTKDDLVVFSFPVYGGRILASALEALSDIKGENTPCICLVTYGNRVYDFALAELCTFAKKQGFIPFAGGALIGQHTYGEIAVGRPNREDLEQTANFFGTLKEKLQSGEIKELSQFTTFQSETKGKGGRFYPQTSEACVSCGACEKLCPVGAIDKTYQVDTSKCIACFRCIKNCKVGAKNMNDSTYIEFAKDFSQKLSTRVENEYFA